MRVKRIAAATAGVLLGFSKYFHSVSAPPLPITRDSGLKSLAAPNQIVGSFEETAWRI